MQSAQNANNESIEEKLKEVFSINDINKDGHISFEEFCKIMKNIIGS